VYKFRAPIQIIGINPYVEVPQRILARIFSTAGKDRGPIQIKGEVNGKAYRQRLVKFRGEWRLYINTTMLPRSPQRIGEKINLTIEFDPEKRLIQKHPLLVAALSKNKKANRIFEGLRPSLQLEIVRYIASLKTEESVKRNVRRAIQFLLGKERFVGRDQP
jgi:hypothetical protein